MMDDIAEAEPNPDEYKGKDPDTEPQAADDVKVPGDVQPTPDEGDTDEPAEQ
jgi:hypothetical protein